MVSTTLADTTHDWEGLRTPEGGFRLSSAAIDGFFDDVGYHDGVNIPLDWKDVFRDGPDGGRRWLFRRPWDLMHMPLRDACCATEKICVGDTDFAAVNASYGDRWASKATYIVVPTTFVYGLNGVVRLIPSMPPSRNGAATCMILYGMFAPYHMESSHYCWDLCRGLDPDLICADPVEGRQITGDINYYVRAVCDLAHARGLKIGFSMRTSSQQMWFGRGDHNEGFDWGNDDHFGAYVEAAKNLIGLGLDAIYLDCAYLAGSGGGWIPLDRLSRFTDAIHNHTWRGQQVGILGEGCDRNWAHWKGLGLNAGFHEDVTGSFSDHTAMDIAGEQAWNDEYRSGWHTRVDNDRGTPAEVIRAGVSRALTRQHGVSKIPGMMSLTDYYLLNDRNIHDLVEGATRWDDFNVFQDSEEAYQHQLQMNDICLQGALQWE